MQFQPLVSSNLSGVHYDPGTQTLTVEFSSGARYAYKNVPKEIYDELVDAGSPGGFFSDSVKGVYPYSRVG